ncbi:MAG: hypothetical protein GY803_05435 [Chloroflexi bacterium]|nr:hypothetical protein [Chloroflexota bacterium]
MNEQRFETGKAPQVTVTECAGALTVGSWKGTAVLASGSDFNGSVEGVDKITLSSVGDLTLTVPEKASLHVEQAQGALTVKHVDGAVFVGTAVGAVTLHDVGSVKIEAANGRLQAENINDSLTLIEARQDVSLRNVVDVGIRKAAASVSIHYANGAVLLEQIGGAVTLHTISGDIILRGASEANLSNLGGKNEVDGIKGVLRLAGGLVNGEHHFQADGDIYVGWPPDGPMTLVAKAALIDNQLPLSDATEMTEADQMTLTGHIENGKPFVSLKTPTHIGLKSLRHGEKAEMMAADFDFTPPPPTLADIVGTAVRQQWPDAAQEQINPIIAAIHTHLAEPPVPTPPSPPSEGKIAAEMAQRKVEKSLQQAKDAMAQAEARLTETEVKAAGAPEATPEAITAVAPKSATDENAPDEDTPDEDTAATPSQTQILKLLKDGLITVEQANTLLNQLKA